MDYKKVKLACIIRVIFAVFLMLEIPLTLYASNAAGDYQNANKTYIELCRNAKSRKYRANWIKVIDKFDHISNKYKSSNFAVRARFRAARLYEDLYGYSGKNQDLKNAIKAYCALAGDFPSSSLADDSLYNAARLFEKKLGNKEKAQKLYKKIVNSFPNGDMARRARKEIRNKSNKKSHIKGLADLSLVKGIRRSSRKGFTRVVIDLQDDVEFNTLTLPANKKMDKSERVVLDLNNARTPPGFPYMQHVNDGLLSNIRVSQFSRDTVRVVLDLAERTYYKTFSLDNPSRLVVDIGKKKASRTKKKRPPIDNGFKKVPMGTKAHIPNNIPSIAAQFSLKVSRIVIDPGHGGKDPGAISPTGLMEKDITLSVAKLLRKRLKKEGFEVFLTREKDVFIPLEERTAFANRKKADLFLSLHVNSNTKKSVRGIETYFLNLTTDSSAIEVAARENATSSKSISDLQLIIDDLMLNSKINESSKFASCLQKSIISSVSSIDYRGKDLGVKQAPFFVLLGAQMPSVLLEIGFITNSKDRRLMTKKSYQNVLIDGIAKGINKYIMKTTYAYLGRK